jgi:hypothetical protein
MTRAVDAKQRDVWPPRFLQGLVNDAWTTP